MNITALVAAGFQIFIMIFKEFLEQKKEFREQKKEDAEFVLNQEKLRVIVDNAVDRWGKKNRAVSRGAANAWDAADEDRKNAGRPAAPSIPSSKPIP